MYGWLGMLAVYGFVVSYGLVCFALPGYLRDHHGVVNLATRTIPCIACLAMVYALVANLYPVPRRRVRQAALRLSGLPGRGSFVFCVSLAPKALGAGGILSAAQDFVASVLFSFSG